MPRLREILITGACFSVALLALAVFALAMAARKRRKR